MKILVLNYEFPPIGGGASPVSYDISRHLAARGHKVTVVTMKYKTLPAYESKEGMEIFRVPCLRKKSNVCHPWEQLTYIISAVLFLRKHLRKNTYDICHTHFIIPTGAIAWYLKKQYCLPYVITAHGSDVIGHNKKRFGVLYRIIKGPWRKIVKDAKAVVSPSMYLMKLMKGNEPEAEYRLIRNGIETGLYVGHNKKKNILVMCRLQETKNVETVLKAVALMDMGEWKLDIVGDGPYKEKLEQLTEQLGIQDKVCFHGWIRNRSEEQLRILGEADIFVSASLVENCPVSVLEALCAECKVVLSDIPAHKEILQENGRLFQTGNVQSLVRALEEARQEEKKLPLETRIQEWDWKQVVLKYEEVLMGGK